MFIESVVAHNFFQLMGKILQIKNLKKLVIRDCIFEAEKNPTEILIKTKLSLDSLVLHSNRIFNNQLNYFLSSIVNLSKFDYSYLQSNTYQNDNETENLIVTFLCNPEFSLSIKELNFNSRNNGFTTLFNCNHLNLSKFSFNCFRPTVNLNTLKCFLYKQTNLIYLGINLNPNNFSKLFFILKSLCSRLQTINYISFSFGFQNIDNLNDLDFIWNLKGIEIKSLLPNYFESLKSESKLEKLYLSFVKLEDMCICDRLNFLPNLTCLFLYRTFLNNNVYQAIFQHLLQLRELCIFDSYKHVVTDFGITGETTGYSITRLKKIEQISINNKQNITDLSLKHFSELKSLKKLLIGETNVSSLSFN